MAAEKHPVASVPPLLVAAMAVSPIPVEASAPLGLGREPVLPQYGKYQMLQSRGHSAAEYKMPFL